MCIIFWSQSAKYQLILAANRDEFLSRPTTPAAFHRFTPESLNSTPDASHSVLSGLDLEGGGTWLGVSLPDAFESAAGERFRFATLTNYTEVIKPEKRPSRGGLVKDFLEGRADLPDYLEQVERIKGDYAGFNLLLGSLSADGEWRMGYVANREQEQARLVPLPLEGETRGVSNATLRIAEGEEPWPKVRHGCAAMEKVVRIATEERELVNGLWGVLSNAHPTPIRHRTHLRYTTLVQPSFMDPTAPLPANPPPFASAEPGALPPPPDRLPAAIDNNVEGEGGYWYATRVQTILLVERSKHGQVKVQLRERDAYVLGEAGRPTWSSKERVFDFVA